VRASQKVCNLRRLPVRPLSLMADLAGTTIFKNRARGVSWTLLGLVVGVNEGGVLVAKPSVDDGSMIDLRFEHLSV
jgi:hypothetical protein